MDYKGLLFLQEIKEWVKYFTKSSELSLLSTFSQLKKKNREESAIISMIAIPELDLTPPK